MKITLEENSLNTVALSAICQFKNEKISNFIINRFGIYVDKIYAITQPVTSYNDIKTYNLFFLDCFEVKIQPHHYQYRLAIADHKFIRRENI